MARRIGIVSTFIIVSLAVLWYGYRHYRPSMRPEKHKTDGLIGVKAKIHLGTVYPGAIRKSLLVDNLSSQPLTPRIRSSCGCARAISIPRPIPPHSQGVVELELDTRKLSGQFERDFLVYAEGMAEDTSRRVVLTGTVITDGMLHFEGDIVDFGPVRHGTKGTAQVAVHRKPPGVLRGCVLEVTDPRVSVQLRIDEKNPSRGTVMLEYHPNRYPEFIQVKLAIVDPEAPEASTNIMVMGSSHGEVRLQPGAVLLGHVVPDVDINSGIDIIPVSQPNVSLTLASATLPEGLRASLTEKGHNWTLRVLGRCQGSPGTAVKGSIQLTVTSNGQHDVYVPVAGVIGE